MSVSRIVLVLIVTTVGMALAAPVAQSRGPDRATARTSKKCKKRHHGNTTRKKCHKTVAPPTDTPLQITPPTAEDPRCADDSAEPNDSIEQAIPFSNYAVTDGVVSAVVCPSNPDFFSYATILPDTETLLVGVTTPDSGLAPDVVAYDSESNVLPWDIYGSTPEQIATGAFNGFMHAAPATTIYLKVTGTASGPSGSYELVIFENPGGIF